MSSSMNVLYNGEQVSVPKEVADFLEQDRKREQAEERRDRRHLSKGTLETVPYCCGDVERPVEDKALWNLRLECLQRAVECLDQADQELIGFRYGDCLTEQEIGTVYGISKAAISKRLKKLRERLKGSVV